jgi:hypothetical protein
MKTIKEWLKQLPQDIYDRALAYEPTNMGSWDEKVDSLCSAIALAFDWQETDEGFNYWDFAADGNYGTARLVIRTATDTLRGFIELTYPSGKKRTVSVGLIEGFEKDITGERSLVTISGNHIEFSESYETVKQLIRGATK